MGFRLLAADALGELACLGDRFDVQLALQERPTCLVLAQGEVPVAIPGMNFHQRPVNVFLQRVHRQQASRQVHGTPMVAILQATIEQATERPPRQLLISSSLIDEPFLERILSQAQTQEKIPAIQTAGLVQGVRAVLLEQRFKLERVHVAASAVQPHRVRVGFQHIISARLGKHLTHTGEGLTQTRARLLLGAALPEHRCQTLAGLKVVGRSRKNRQQGPRFARRQAVEDAPVDLGLEATQEAQIQSAHGPSVALILRISALGVVVGTFLRIFCAFSGAAPRASHGVFAHGRHDLFPRPG